MHTATEIYLIEVVVLPRIKPAEKEESSEEKSQDVLIAVSTYLSKKVRVAKPSLTLGAAIIAIITAALDSK